jgi:hypothetical protein
VAERTGVTHGAVDAGTSRRTLLVLVTHAVSVAHLRLLELQTLHSFAIIARESVRANTLSLHLVLIRLIQRRIELDRMVLAVSSRVSTALGIVEQRALLALAVL